MARSPEAGRRRSSIGARRKALATKSASVAALTREVRAFCQARDWDQFHGPKDLAIGLATEAAELLAHFRFLDPKQAEERLQSPDDRQAIEYEVGDTLFFLLRFCERCAIDPAEALRKKLAVNKARYPVDLSRGNNRKYNRL